jgi:hypothetical protein
MSELEQSVSSQPAEQQNLGPQLTLADLTLVLQTLQAMSQRGAIRIDEMSTIGGLYDRLFSFLEAQGAITREDPTAQPTEPK